MILCKNKIAVAREIIDWFCSLDSRGWCLFACSMLIIVLVMFSSYKLCNFWISRNIRRQIGEFVNVCPPLLPFFISLDLGLVTYGLSFVLFGLVEEVVIFLCCDGYLVLTIIIVPFLNICKVCYIVRNHSNYYIVSNFGQRLIKINTSKVQLRKNNYDGLTVKYDGSNMGNIAKPKHSPWTKNLIIEYNRFLDWKYKDDTTTKYTKKRKINP